MCKAPNTLDNGTVVACRECSLCRERAINDWVGRNIAESKTAIACHAVTLTYGRNGANDVDHERATLLTYSDIQKYLKLLRRHGYPVRYHVTGEYGSKKGRAHWHIMLYWLDKVPPHELDKNFMEDHWPHGWSYWTEPSFHAIRYNCKYIMKGMGEEERQGHMAMSKKPPLGTAYFRELAEQYVREGLAPQTPEYRFPEVRRRKKDGTEEVIPFWLKDRPLEMFLEHFVTTWRATYPGVHIPSSELVEEYLDPGAWKERSETNKPFVPPEQPRNPILKLGPRDSWEWWEQYLKGAKDGEERQKREAEFERWEVQQDEQRKRWLVSEDELEQQFYANVYGHPTSPGSGDGGDAGVLPGNGRQAGPLDIEPRDGDGCRPYWEGKIGRWNRHYPK